MRFINTRNPKKTQKIFKSKTSGQFVHPPGVDCIRGPAVKRNPTFEDYLNWHDLTERNVCTRCGCSVDFMKRTMTHHVKEELIRINRIAGKLGIGVEYIPSKFPLVSHRRLMEGFFEAQSEIMIESRVKIQANRRERKAREKETALVRQNALVIGALRRVQRGKEGDVGNGD